MNFKVVHKFEETIAKFFGAPYGVAVDCCTHGLEICLRYTKATHINIPTNTYLSVPLLANKLNLDRIWTNTQWSNYYSITENIIDAAVLWKQSSYVHTTFMVVSFQFKKHLSLGRGGMILTDNKEAVPVLRAMSYDGRSDNSKPWDQQEINITGYHYYMTPEIAQLGLDKFDQAVNTEPKQWSWKDYPNLLNYNIFKNG